MHWVIFLVSGTSGPLWLWQPQWLQWPQQPPFIKNLTELNVSINPGTKMTYPGLTMWVGSSKINYFSDFWPFSIGGCEGHPMRPNLNLKDKSQMSKPNEYRYLQIKFYLHISFCQSQFKKKHFVLGCPVSITENNYVNKLKFPIF